jgi:hypothetical protein
LADPAEEVENSYRIRDVPVAGRGGCARRYGAVAKLGRNSADNRPHDATATACPTFQRGHVNDVVS